VDASTSTEGARRAEASAFSKLDMGPSPDGTESSSRAGDRFAVSGFAVSGFAAAGFAAAGFAATGFSATGFSATGFSATGFSATG
jgi:hypothetical protein